MILFDEEYPIRVLTDLVNINSVFPGEEEIMLFLEGELIKHGFAPRRLPVEEGRCNLLVRIGSGSPIFCLNAHADTIPPSGSSVPKARIEGDRMLGLGSCDDKASIAAMISAIRAIAESGIRLNGTLDLLISVDEEGDAKGVRTAASDGYRCDMVLTGEPTSLEIVPTHCGLIFLDIVTYGKATHGSIPMEGINAIDRMFALISGLRAMVEQYPPHPLVGPPTLNLGIIRAGDRPNRVPDRCEASIDIRIVPPMKVEEVLERIEDYFTKWQGKAEYRVTKQGGPLDTPHDSPLVSALKAAGTQVLGKEPPIASWRGWTEAESFQSRLGIDAVVFGAGALKQAHSAEEFVGLEQVRRAARIYAETAVRMLMGNK